MSLRYLSIVYIVFFIISDEPIRFYLGLPWVLYLLYESFKSRQFIINFLLIALFILSFSYDKTTSKLSYALIGDEIILQKDLYFRKGYINPNILSVSDSNFSIEDSVNFAILPRGEKLKIVSFIKTNYNSYDIELKCPRCRDIAMKLDLKLNDEGNIQVWSNNFFYTIGTLNSGIIPYYRFWFSYFWIFYALYPIALIYMMIEIFKKYLVKTRFNPINIIIYLIAYYYVIFASINDGFSGFMLGIPYAIYLLYDTVSNFKKSRFIYLNIIVLISSFYLVVADRSDFKILYPMIGENYTTTEDINYTYDNSLNIINFSNYLYEVDKKKKIFKLKKGDIFTIKREYISGHPDMGTTYIFEIDSDKFSDFKNYIKAFESKDYFKEREKIYIFGYDLDSFMRKQGLNYQERDLENFFTYFSFYLFIYPIIFFIFSMLLASKNEIDSMKSILKHKIT